MRPAPPPLLGTRVAPDRGTVDLTSTRAVLELIDDPDHRGMRLARALGLPQEALRLGCNVVGSEHLLMATLCDPLIRWKVKSVGVDMRDVQELVRRTADDRHADTRLGFTMTVEAAALLVDAADATPRLDPGERPDPDVFSSAMIAVMMTLLRDRRDTTAGRILADLELTDPSTGLYEALADSANAPLQQPSLPLPDTEDAGGVGARD